MGSRPDRRARGMLHISGGDSEWGVAESGRGGSNVPPTGGNNRWGNVIDIRSGERRDFHFVCEKPFPKQPKKEYQLYLVIFTCEC